MISIVELVVVIYEGLQQPKKFHEQATFGLQFSKIVLKWSNIAMLVKFILGKWVRIQLQFYMLSMSVHLRSGALILLLVIYLRMGIRSTSLWP